MHLARQSIMIVGWDLHSGLRLICNGESGDYPETLGKFLDYQARERDELNIYLLSWDFSMIYAMEREFFPRFKLEWLTHKRIRFQLDGEHPIGGSQHQKIVVIDDAVAFAWRSIQKPPLWFMPKLWLVMMCLSGSARQISVTGRSGSIQNVIWPLSEKRAAM
jgi:phosphatidylserine/phosphatidylglycerophosphate/cardiolipin synthase-like enzyme